MAEKLNVDPQVLNQAADGINKIIGELSDLGLGSATGEVGRGFSEVKLSPTEAGKESVQTAFATFCDRWSWGVRALVQNGNEVARTLGLAAGLFHDQDQELAAMVKETWTDIAGNPHLSAEEADKRSWGDTFADNPYNAIRHPDYSAASFDQAMQRSHRDMQAVAAVAPGAAANLLVPGAVAARWNSGDAARAAAIMNPQGEK
ncbi:type VII secretion target [Nocardia nova]|uniref:type VII secretion target n=1 Tax=Nocardia nova TaxID=37330 RepID=UPI0033F9D881